MQTISVNNKHNQHQVLDNITFTANAITEVDIFAWDKIKKTSHYDLDHLTVDESRFSALMSEFRDATFAKFESQGEASLKASMTQNGTLPKPEILLAHEWLESKVVARKDEEIAIAKAATSAALDQAQSAKLSVKIAIFAAIIAVVAVIISLVGLKK